MKTGHQGTRDTRKTAGLPADRSGMKRVGLLMAAAGTSVCRVAVPAGVNNWSQRAQIPASPNISGKWDLTPVLLISGKIGI